MMEEHESINFVVATQLLPMSNTATTQLATHAVYTATECSDSASDKPSLLPDDDLN